MSQLTLNPRVRHAAIAPHDDTWTASHGRWTTVNAGGSLHIMLRDGFRGHTVVVSVDGREIYRRSGVTTVGGSAGGEVEVEIASDVAHVAVSATPGPFHGSLDIDLSAHPHVAISLVGDGTVSFEPSVAPFHDRGSW